jgi:hypothetical protein
MSIYIHDGTSDLPSITLDKSDATFEIAGASFPEDARDFYQPVLDWIDDFRQEPLGELNLCFKLTYYNTSSSKMIHSIFEKFENIYESGCKLSIEWHYDPDDEDMYEAGLGYKERIEIPFQLIEM